MPEIPLVFVLGHAGLQNIGAAAAYPALARVQTANLKFLLATGCGLDFAEAVGLVMALNPKP